jgi:hypothetical protein
MRVAVPFQLAYAGHAHGGFPDLKPTDAFAKEVM